jgi:hypothetical protein
VVSESGLLVVEALVGVLVDADDDDDDTTAATQVRSSTLNPHPLRSLDRDRVDLVGSHGGWLKRPLPSKNSPPMRPADALPVEHQHEWGNIRATGAMEL